MRLAELDGANSPLRRAAPANRICCAPANGWTVHSASFGCLLLSRPIRTHGAERVTARKVALVALSGANCATKASTSPLRGSQGYFRHVGGLTFAPHGRLPRQASRAACGATCREGVRARPVYLSRWFLRHGAADVRLRPEKWDKRKVSGCRAGQWGPP